MAKVRYKAAGKTTYEGGGRTVLIHSGQVDEVPGFLALSLTTQRPTEFERVPAATKTRKKVVYVEAVAVALDPAPEVPYVPPVEPPATPELARARAAIDMLAGFGEIRDRLAVTNATLRSLVGDA